MAETGNLFKGITFITGNQHKVKEAQGIFQKLGYCNWIMLISGYPEIQGNLEEVASFGAQHVARRLGKPVIVEDAGIFIKALKWFPGTYSSYVQDTLGNTGILKLMSDVEDRYAEFRSVVGFCTPKTEPQVFLGAVKGHIAYQEKGKYGFAYDPFSIQRDMIKPSENWKEKLKTSFLTVDVPWKSLPCGIKIGLNN